jgi:peptide/nickel transport system permease protein
VSTSAENLALADQPAQAPVQSEEQKAQRERLRLLVRTPTFIAGALVLGLWALSALFGDSVAPHSPFQDDLLGKLSAPSAEHWFGTDRLGRDIFSRVLVGARDILIVAPLATLVGTVLGTAIGLTAGYFRGAVEEVMMRVIDAFLAIPLTIIGLLALVALGPSRVTVIAVIGIVFAPIIARTVRAAVLAERELEYVAAATLRNERAPYIMFAEILPNVMAPVLVEFTVRLGYAIFAIATLSFLGFGIQPPAPDWGLQIFEHYGLISGGFWWPVLFPALAIASLVIGVNLVSDGVTRVYER